ncbi:MAG: outer membrane beta-barrel protein [Bacteroidia bacterium]|nr:outer membrane beta-barrel protein [Bacteroidia bacterium]
MLRIKTIFTILLFLAIEFCFAQGFKSQIHAGINFSQVDGDRYSGYNQIGLNGGFAFYRELKKNKNLGFEINYSSKGSRKKTSEKNPDIFKLRINYVCIPVFAEFKNVIKNYKNLSLKAGISGNIFVNAKTDFGFGWQNEELKPVEISGIIGITHKIDKRLSFCITHENSIISIEKKIYNSINYYTNRRGLFNRLIIFSLRYNL